MLFIAFPWKTRYAVHSNEVQIINVEIRQVIQKTNRNAYNQRD